MKPCKQDNISTRPYRFKKWTNKSYAVFNSIGREISIGVLSSDISSRIGAKDSCHSNGLFFYTTNKVAEEGTEDVPDKQETDHQQLSEPITIVSVSHQGDPGCAVIKITSSPSSGNSSLARFNVPNANGISYTINHSLTNYNLKFIIL